MNIQAQNVQNFLWRLRRKMLKIFSGAFGAKISKISLAPSAQNIQFFFLRLRRKILKIFSPDGAAVLDSFLDAYTVH